MNSDIKVSTASLPILLTPKTLLLFPHRGETTATHLKCILVGILLCLKVALGYSVITEILYVCACIYIYIYIEREREFMHTHFFSLYKYSFSNTTMRQVLCRSTYIKIKIGKVLASGESVVQWEKKTKTFKKHSYKLEKRKKIKKEMDAKYEA